MLRLVAIGALGNMLSPAAGHLSGKQGTDRFIRIYDRHPLNAGRQQRRDAWISHGAEVVSSYEDLIRQDDFEGIIICAGKNGDDQEILSKVIPLICKKFPCARRPFILHCSTVSIQFVAAAYNACQSQNISYANYPLTGGEKGAANATMLILASGNDDFFKQLTPFLSKLGKPKYFGEDIAAAAKVKLIGHLMVFNGLLGIGSAVALQSKAVQLSMLSTEEFFDFLNQGAGGTRQWDVAIKQAVTHSDWHSGFLLPHAAIDAIYTADLLIQYQMPSLTIFPILQLAASFIFLIKNNYRNAASQTLVKALIEMPKELESFIMKCQHLNPITFLNNCIELLPPELSRKVKLNINAADILGLSAHP